MAKGRKKLLIGAVLRQARTKAGLTQETLAFEVEVDRTYISYLESDKQSPTLEMLATICGALGIATSELVRQAEKGR